MKHLFPWPRVQPMAIRTALTGFAFLAPLGSQPLPGKPSAAQDTAKRLAELKKKIETDRRSHPTVSVASAEEALGLFPDRASETYFLLALVRDCTALSQFPRASAYLERGRRLVAITGDERSRLQLEVAGASLLVSQGRPNDARVSLQTQLPSLESYRKAYPRDTGMAEVHMTALNVLGDACRKLAFYPEAITAFQASQHIAEELGDRAGRALVLDQMAYLYNSVGRTEEAEVIAKSGILLAEELQDFEMQARLHLTLGMVYGLKNQAELQAGELAAASRLAARIHDVDIQRSITVNMADVCLHNKNYKGAQHYAEVARKLALEAQDQPAVAVCDVNRGIALNRLGRSAEGLQAIQAGLAYFVSTHSLEDEAEITGVLAGELAFAGDFPRAYQEAVRFKELSDSLASTRDQKRIAEASAAYDNENKQSLINALQREKKTQGRLRLLWMALVGLGFTTALALIFSRKKLQAANGILAEMSLKDPLTALANRRYLHTRIGEDLAQALRMHNAGKSPEGQARLVVNIDVIFLMIDIDHFKFVNDTHGHAAGDLVLKQIGFILTQTMRDSDTVGRWGGEEFFVVAKQTCREDAHIVAERIRSRVAGFPFDLGNGKIIHCTCSVGFSTYPFFRNAPSRVAWEAVAEASDQCLYAAKAMGRNTWVGVHEAEGALDLPREALGATLDVRDLIAQGFLRTESRANRPIVWGD